MGGRDTINCQMPTPRDSSCIKCPGFGGEGGMLAAGIDSHISDEENKRQPKKTQLPSAQVTSAV